MNISKHKLWFVFIAITTAVVGQTKNEFFNREYWKSNPDIASIEEKIAEGNDPTALNRYSFDAVVYAILEKTSNTSIKYLLSKEGNGVNKLTHDKRTYVFWAAYKNNVELMEYLIANNARMDLKDSHSYSVSTFAAATGNTNPKVYELCIANGIDIQKDKDEHGANALLLAIPNVKDYTFIAYLESKGLDLKSVDEDGNGAINYAARSGNKEMIELLIKKGLPYKELNKIGGNAILMASRPSRKGYNSLAFLQYLEGLGISANVATKKGKTPLHYLAYRNKDLKMYDFFIDKGVNPNQGDEDGNTPLINASRRNTLEIIRYLIEKNSDLNHKNKKGTSALAMAVRSNSYEVVDFLVKNKAAATVKDNDGNNLAYYLVKGYNTKKSEEFQKKLQLLQDNGVDFTANQHNENTLFHIALDKNNMTLLKEVQKLGIPINAKNKDGLTVLHKAVMQAKDVKTIKYLLSIGADKSIVTNFGESVYDLASENELLKNNNIDVNFLK